MKPNLIARDAIAIVAQRQTVKAQAPDAGDFYERRLNDLRARLWDDALAIATDDPTTSPEDLADVLDPGSDVARPTVPDVTRPECETYVPEPWTPAEADDVERAKERIAEIRASLRGGEVA